MENIFETVSQKSTTLQTDSSLFTLSFFYNLQQFMELLEQLCDDYPIYQKYKSYLRVGRFFIGSYLPTDYLLLNDKAEIEEFFWSSKVSKFYSAQNLSKWKILSGTYETVKKRVISQPIYLQKIKERDQKWFHDNLSTLFDNKFFEQPVSVIKELIQDPKISDEDRESIWDFIDVIVLGCLPEEQKEFLGSVKIK